MDQSRLGSKEVQKFRSQSMYTLAVKYCSSKKRQKDHRKQQSAQQESVEGKQALPVAPLMKPKVRLKVTDAGSAFTISLCLFRLKGKVCTWTALSFSLCQFTVAGT